MSSNLIEILKNNSEVIHGQGVSISKVKEAAKMLELTFSLDYIDYLEHFGILAYDGQELTGLIGDDRTNVVNITKELWKENPLIPHNLYVIEDTGIDTIVVWQNEKGQIFQSAVGLEPVKICDSLIEFLFDY